MPLTLHPDRALPADPGTRALARQILERTAGLPIVSPHGHVDAGMLARDQPFADPASLLVVPDHYVLRMLVSQGVPHADLGIPVPGRALAAPREIWRTFASHWHFLRGTPSRFWLEHVLVEVFGQSLVPSAESADALYDAISARLAEPASRPLALLDRFGIELLATTDAPADPLDAHAVLAGLPALPGPAGLPGSPGPAGPDAPTARPGRPGRRVVPTFRPDAVVQVAAAGWTAQVERLGRSEGIEVDGYRALLEALRRSRERFVAAGALATDHSHLTNATAPLPDAEAERIVQDALRGEATAAQGEAFAGHMLFELARMSVDDGLVMQLHPGVLRDHDRGIRDSLGSDIGYDIPVATEFVRALRPLLEAFGHDPRLRLVVFTVDEDTYSRELAPLAGVYPALRLGAPWWFLDTPDGMRRFRELVTDTAGFRNTTGFVDDTRAFCSIPARHDLARRVDAGYLARLVAEHRLDLDEALDTAVDLAYRLPRETYRLG
ncbi:glucuronate isomerase [Cellulomonas hominis]